jgi:hypothetical protein
MGGGCGYPAQPAAGPPDEDRGGYKLSQMTAFSCYVNKDKMADSLAAKGSRGLFFQNNAQFIALRREKKFTATIAGRLGRQRPSIDSLLVLAAAVDDQAVPEQKKGPDRPKKLTKNILVIVKGQATK